MTGEKNKELFELSSVAVFIGRQDGWTIYRHPEYCHVKCSMTPSMKDGLYRVYILLGKQEGFATIVKATCECPGW